MPLLKAFALPVLVAALLLALWAQHQGLRQLQARLTDAVQTQRGYANALSALQQHAEHNSTATARLAGLWQQSQAQQHRRDQQWEQLKREHDDLKGWAESVLPAAVGRLHQRPAITGTAGYRHWLQQGGGLHPAAEQSEPQRGSESGH